MAQLQYLLDVYRPDGNYVPYHYHPCYEFVFYCNGRGTNHYVLSSEGAYRQEYFIFERPAASPENSQEMAFNRNTLFCYKPHSYHDESHKMGGDVLAIGFLSDKPVELGQMVYTDLQPEIVQHLQMIAKEHREKNEGYLNAINAMIDLLIVYLSRIESKQRNRQPSLETLKNYIDNYFMTDIKVADLAKTSFYTADHFIRVFKKNYGIHPKQYILKKRLEESITLLQNTNISINDIAARVGYHSNAEFSAFIKKYTGQTPTQIRKTKGKID